MLLCTHTTVASPCGMWKLAIGYGSIRSTAFLAQSLKVFLHAAIGSLQSTVAARVTMPMPWMSGVSLDAPIIGDWRKITERLTMRHFHQTVGVCSRSLSVVQSRYGALGMIGQHIHSNMNAGSTLLPFLRTGSKSLAFLMAALVYGPPPPTPKGLSMTFHNTMYNGRFSPRTASACYLVVLMELQCGVRKAHVAGLRKRT